MSSNHTTVTAITRIVCLGLLLTPLALLPASELKVISLFSDHMVLQREVPVPVWGRADPGERVTVEFAGQTKATMADADGKWRVRLDPMPASSAPREMTMKGGSGPSLVVKDILVGEVWIASGQSNMAFALNDVIDAQVEIAAADFPQIRQYWVQGKASLEPGDSLGYSSWTPCTPKTAGGYSAVAYFFARDLQRTLGIPVGILTAAWGGTCIEPWTSRQSLAAIPGVREFAERQIADLRRLPADQAAFPALMSAWEMANGLDDTQNEGLKQGWATVDFNDTAWSSVKAPFALQNALTEQTGGIVWFRKNIELTAEQAGKDFNLFLGWADHYNARVYFNGEQLADVGKTAPDFDVAPLSCRIPGSLVRADKNSIAVRFATPSAYHTVLPSGDSLGVPSESGKHQDDNWKMMAERKFPPLKPEAMAARPQMRTKDYSTSSAIYNGVIHPLIPYAIRGAIWYQGENNEGQHADLYRLLLPALISGWRSAWGQGDFPFYFVQLPNNEVAPRVHANAPNGRTIVREGEFQTLAASANTGMAVTIDLGEWNNGHPRNKRDVGMRLALLARVQTYVEKGLICQSPLYKSHKVDGKTIRVQFDTGGSPLMVGRKIGLAPTQETPGIKLDWFEIAGADGKFVCADAVIDGDSVVVSSTTVPDPMTVRYAWAGNPDGCNLYNKAGLPASPFCTDSK